MSRLAVISDIHSNLQALTAVWARMDEIGIDTVHCLGDVVGYGASPLHNLDLVMSICETNATTGVCLSAPAASATSSVSAGATPTYSVFVTATGNYHVITHDHIAAMKHQAIVCNIGHFDNEIDVASLKKYEWENIKPQVDHVIFPDGKRIILLAQGRLVNLGCATGHPSFVMSNSFTNQTLAQIELWTKGSDYERAVYTLPKHLDEEVARLHIDKIGAHMTTLSDYQADYIGVPVDGPYEPEHYRY